MIHLLGGDCTLLVGDHIMADKLVLRSRKPKRGETVAFKFPERPEQDFVKRVIAVAGDKLETRSGHPWLNDWEVPHCLVGKAAMPSSEGEALSGELHFSKARHTRILSTSALQACTAHMTTTAPTLASGLAGAAAEHHLIT